MLLLDVSYCEVVLKGKEKFYIIDKEVGSKNKKDNKIEEEVTEFVMISRENIPIRHIMKFMIKHKQELSIMAICGSHQDVVKTFVLGDNSKNVTYEITVVVNCNKAIDVFITDTENQIKILELKL